MSTYSGQRYPRHDVSLFVSLGAQGQPPGRTRNISLGGLFLETGERPAIGAVVDIWFVWGEDTFVTKAQVIRHAEDGVGVAFIDPDQLVLAALTEIIGAEA